ncbi:MAG: ATP-binding protein [archaeon]
MNIESQIQKTIQKYKLLDKKDKILVALSGGKDSAVLAFVLKKFGYNIEGIHVNLGLGEYSEESSKAVKKLCEKLGIKLYEYYVKDETGKTMLKIFKENKERRLSSCTMCGVFKKWILNKKTRELKADKIATGHHKEDELQTFFMNILKGSPKLNVNFGPILKIKDKKFAIKIKPLFFVKEKEIEKFCIEKKLPIVKKICPYRRETYRVEVRNFFWGLTDKEKENMIKNFTELSKKIKREKSKVNYCETCGEPSRNIICKKCSLIK